MALCRLPIQVIEYENGGAVTKVLNVETSHKVIEQPKKIIEQPVKQPVKLTEQQKMYNELSEEEKLELKAWIEERNKAIEAWRKRDAMFKPKQEHGGPLVWKKKK